MAKDQKSGAEILKRLRLGHVAEKDRPIDDFLVGPLDFAIATSEQTEAISKELHKELASLLKERLSANGYSEQDASEIARLVMSEFRESSNYLPGKDQIPVAVDFAIAAISAWRKPATATHDFLCQPEGQVTPYVSKRVSGPIDAFLRANYPQRPDAPPLTLQFLRAHDPKAVGAYNRLDPTERENLGLRRESDLSDELLASHNIDLSTEKGVKRARQLHSLMQYRLYRKTS